MCRQILYPMLYIRMIPLFVVSRCCYANSYFIYTIHFSQAPSPFLFLKNAIDPPLDVSTRQTSNELIEHCPLPSLFQYNEEEVLEPTFLYPVYHRDPRVATVQ